jgi:hypothetical protein
MGPEPRHNKSGRGGVFLWAFVGHPDSLGAGWHFPARLIRMPEEGTILERLERIERHLQEQQAEIFAFRLILMVLVTRLLGARPDFAEESLGDLKDAALTHLQNTRIEGTPTQSDFAKSQIKSRLERMFHDLVLALLEARREAGQSGRH